MKNAIEKAIEGGFEPSHVNWEDHDWKEFCWSPKFWQCLGKALGGMQITIKKSSLVKEHIRTKRFSWKRRWHGFIDWLAEGKSPDEFFTNLLK
jgi:hypothetical protein